MELLYPTLEFNLQDDVFVVWVRWVTIEGPPAADEPANQGIRVELTLNQNTLLGPSVMYKRDLEVPVYLRTHRGRTAEILRAVGDGGTVDIHLIIHGSVANAPYVALHHVREYTGESVDTAPLAGTPLLQLQPSTPGDRWHVAGQASLRARISLAGETVRLPIVH